jgi:putative nucleotidyltransferase with HDIG domain
MISREEARQLMTSKVQDENLRRHMWATEAIMASLAEKFHEDSEKWAITGLLHDIDYEETKDNPELHSKVGADFLKTFLTDEMIYAVLAHNNRHGLERKTLLDKSLWATDPLTGFIMAVAMVRPDKKLVSVELKSMKKKFKEIKFAAGANRDQIKSCENELNIPLDDFLLLGLQALQQISDELGL